MNGRKTRCFDAPILICCILLSAFIGFGSVYGAGLDSIEKAPELYPGIGSSSPPRFEKARPEHPNHEPSRAYGSTDLLVSQEDNCAPDFVWEGTADSMLYGNRIYNIGDFNGDGFDEIWICASGYGTPYSHGYVHSGADQSELFRVEAEPEGSFILAAAGADVNNDGYDDIIFGDGNYAGINFGAGRVYVIYGGPAPFPAVIPAGDADIKIDGDSATYFGRGLAALGDIDGDGHGDFAVGASEINLGGTGHVYIYSGQSMDTLYTLAGESSKDGFGYFLANAGDVNGDGRADLMVNAPQHPLYGATGPGQVYVYSVTDGQLLYHISGEVEGDVLGWYGMNGAGDLNQDGYSDFIMGSQTNDGSGTNAGRVYVFMGGSGPFPVVANAITADYLVTGVGASRLGMGVGGIEDVNGDGYPDFVAGMIYFMYYNAGKLLVMSGADGSLLLTLSGQQPYENFGYSCATAWDLDADGVKDLLIGAPCETEIHNGGPARGRVYGYRIADLDADQISAQCDNCPAVTNANQSFTIGVTGDIDDNSSLTSADIIHGVNFVFKNQPLMHPCEAVADVNCSGAVTSADLIVLVNIVFKGQDAPCDICQVFNLDWSCP